MEAFASGCGGPGAEYEDLTEVGSTALLNAIDRCDPKRGDEFLAFAVPAIADDIRRHLRDALEGVGPNGEYSPDDASGEIELDERVLHADVFKALDHTEQAIVYLRLVREMSGREAAAELGISKERLRRGTRSALAKLRGELEGSAFPGAAQARAHTGNGEAAETETKRGTAHGNGTAKNGHAASPSTKAAHSGRILVRMPESLHADLARAAESEHVSLNQFITNALSAAVGWQQPAEAVRRSPRWLPAAVVTNIIVVVLAGIAAMILLVVALNQGL